MQYFIREPFSNLLSTIYRKLCRHRDVARTNNVGGAEMKAFGHALYFSKALLLPPPHTYFLIDFKESRAPSWQKWGSCPQPHDHTTGPPWLDPQKNFQNEGSQKAGKWYFEIGFANTVNTSLYYKFFQLLHKHYVALTSSKIT